MKITVAGGIAFVLLRWLNRNLYKMHVRVFLSKF